MLGSPKAGSTVVNNAVAPQDHARNKEAQEARAAELERQIEALRLELKQAQTERDELRRRNFLLQEELSYTHIEFDRIQNELKVMQVQLKQKEDAYKSVLSTYQRVGEMRSEEVQTLKSQLQQKTEELVDSQRQHKKIAEQRIDKLDLILEKHKALLDENGELSAQLQKMSLQSNSPSPASASSSTGSEPAAIASAWNLSRRQSSGSGDSVVQGEQPSVTVVTSGGLKITSWIK